MQISYFENSARKYHEGIKMKICYIADAQSIHTQRWVKWFAEHGHEVHLIAEYPAELENVKIHLVKERGGVINFVRRTWQTMKTVKKIKPDILHAHYVTGYGFFGAFSGFHPLIITAWGSDVLIDAKESFFKRVVVKYALRKADLITCDGENMREAMTKLGADSQKINIIYFGIDTQKFSPKQRSEKLREELGISNSPMIISLRNLEPIYDIESLVKSVPLVLKDIPEAKFVIAGRGSREAELKRLAKSIGVLDSIMFIGMIPNDELPQYLTSADIYVSTSLSDAGLAASTGEAMACGLPVIITDFGVNREWVEDGKNGFIIPLKNPKALAEKIITLLGNEDLRTKFGKKNRKIIEERLNYYIEMEKMENLYKQLSR